MNNVFYSMEASQNNFITISHIEYWKQKEDAIESAENWINALKKQSNPSQRYYRVIEINLNGVYTTGDQNVIFEKRIE